METSTVGYCKYLHWSYIAGCLVQDHLNLSQSFNSNEGDGKTAAELRIVWTRLRVSLTFHRNGSSFFKNHHEAFTISSISSQDVSPNLHTLR